MRIITQRLREKKLKNNNLNSQVFRSPSLKPRYTCLQVNQNCYNLFYSRWPARKFAAVSRCMTWSRRCKSKVQAVVFPGSYRVLIFAPGSQRSNRKRRFSWRCNKDSWKGDAKNTNACSHLTHNFVEIYNPRITSRKPNSNSRVALSWFPWIYSWILIRWAIATKEAINKERPHCKMNTWE